MQALRLVSNQLQIVDIPRPAAKGEALVRVEYAGICATDAAIVREGYASFSGTLGHEFVGVVEASPDPSWIGRRVVADINVGCGRCPDCTAGDARHCAQRTVLGIRGRDGAFAEYVALPLANLYAVPNTVSPLEAVFAEPLAAACRILEQVTVPPAATIGVLGDGKLGQLIAQVFHAHRLSVTLVGRHPRKLQTAARLGLPVCSANDLNAAARVFDIVVEATGRPAGFADALRLVRPRGTVVLKSTFHRDCPLHPASVVIPEVTIVGSRCGDMTKALALLAAKAVQPTTLIEAVYNLADGLEAFRHAMTPGALKVLLRPAEAPATNLA
ncbi:MAG: alcohol dehydrogenase catalytic domain-containing protein [Chloracidobacterium sp.]|nr:alcohol dehydrogenase catalytic domain-containing protein [Chloracidobacterium sp.]MDW8216770.1 alcohol dehydrogenase catalytic domain-containing protein [Acidobacteriota bacterium]